LNSAEKPMFVISEENPSFHSRAVIAALKRCATQNHDFSAA
jgi:hypothetical protein